MWQWIKNLKDKPLWAVLLAVVVVIATLHQHPETLLQDDIAAIRADLDQIKQELGAR